MPDMKHAPGVLGVLGVPDATGVRGAERRTIHSGSKYRVSILVRTLALFLIPLLYFALDGRTQATTTTTTTTTATTTTTTTADANRQGQRLNITSERLLGAAGRDKEVPASRRLLSVAGLSEAVPANRTCTPPAILEFPSDGLTRMQRKSGFVAVHFAMALYCFLLLAVVCEEYFVPAIEQLCARLQLSLDVAGATLMAAASSSPELFISCVGTFVTQGDLGVGAIVGSAVFNVLAVPACCVLLATRAVELDRWAVSRDCLMYALAVAALVLALRDNVVYWHEALALVLLYALYILAMIFDERLSRLVRGCGYLRKPRLYSEITPLLVNGKCGDSGAPGIGRGNFSERGIAINKTVSMDCESASRDGNSPLRQAGGEASCGRRALWACVWPVEAALWATMPDCRRRPALCPLTFALCVLWIGAASYILAWIITILGDTLDIPDSVTGLTVLAAGTSLPEAVSSVLVTNRGHGTMGISNAIGSNTFDILLCLGLPWLVKSLCFPATPGDFRIRINSGGLWYSAAALLGSLVLLYGALASSGFRPGQRAGAACALAYAAFLALAALLELNVLFYVNPPVCAH